MALRGSMKDPATELPKAGAALLGATNIGANLVAVYDLTGGSSPQYRRTFHQDGSITEQEPLGVDLDLYLNTQLAGGTDHT